jgi:hypothetical protein
MFIFTGDLVWASTSALVALTLIMCGSSLVQFPCGILKGDVYHQSVLSPLSFFFQSRPFPVTCLKQLHLTKEKEYRM